jgi:hypothetical protein
MMRWRMRRFRRGHCHAGRDPLSACQRSSVGWKTRVWEKPLVLDEAEAEELIRIAHEKNLVLMVGHLLQYHPVFTRLKELA